MILELGWSINILCLLKILQLQKISFLGNEPNERGKITIKDAAKKLQALSEKYGLDVDPNAKIEDISVGMQQRVEILKTLYRGAEILIFDEPTAVVNSSRNS